MLEWARTLDHDLLLRVNREWTNTFLDRLLPTVTSFGAWMPVIVFGVVIAFWRGGFRVRSFLICALCAVLLNEALISGPLKKITGRLRPHEAVPEVVQRALPKANPELLAMFQLPKITPAKLAAPDARGKSFPSSHTVNMFAVATVALLLLGRHGAWFFLVAALVAWSRVYCGVHWPGDVIFSVPLGVLAGWAAVRLISTAWNKFGPAWLPDVQAHHPRLRG